MKVIGIMLAILLFVAMIAGLGYGVLSVYEILAMQWGSLNEDWKAILIVMSALLVFCSLLISFSIRSSIKNYGLKGNGKVMAYNDFTQWYSALKNKHSDSMKSDILQSVTNQMVLWGSDQVAKQTRILYEVFHKDESDREKVLEKAEDVYIEIRRELGLGGTSGDNSIV